MPSLPRLHEPMLAVGVAASSSTRIPRSASVRTMRLDSSIAVAQRIKPPHRFLPSLHQPAEFICKFDMRCTTKQSVRSHSGCGHATSIHLRVHPACASSFRCQTTALSRGSSFDRIGCLPTRRNGPGQDFPAPAPHRHVCKHGKCSSALSSSLCTRHHPLMHVRHRDCLAALPPRFRVLLLRPRSQTPAFEAPARLIAGTGHHPGRQSPSPVRTSLV
jgi:hypothetical protein